MPVIAVGRFTEPQDAELRVNTEATGELLRALAPDAVILATGDALDAALAI